MISSWTSPSFYDMDFGFHLGKPEALRRPLFTPLEGLAYLIPRLFGGETVFGICLREGDTAKLRVDHEFSKLAVYTG
ncbi:hypothetical protein MFIFM68171_01387 [Madurella fahalii]|uniref:Uncharacterized protein n=1 Tax=Madurella fahalii TaxID=1157608 RepID=A0ABQ0G098_9PEZI